MKVEGGGGEAGNSWSMLRARRAVPACKPERALQGKGKTGQLFLAWFAFALLTACDRAPQLPKLQANDAVVAFGDSLTEGVGAGAESTYPAWLSKTTGHAIINAGISGETTAEGLERLPAMLEEHRPKLVLLCLGGNDMLRQQNMASTESNLRKIIQTIRASGASVVLIGVPEPKLFSSPPALYEKLADEFDLPYEGEIFDEVLKNPRLKSDPIHANAEGYRLVAERLAELLKEAGAL